MRRRELLCDHLTADRYRALPAPSASDALRLCGYNQPDLMVLDLGLPDAPGIDVLREIRAAGGALRPGSARPGFCRAGRAKRIDCAAFEAGRGRLSAEAVSTIRSCSRGWRQYCGGAPAPDADRSGSAIWTVDPANPPGFRSASDRWSSRTRNSRCCARRSPAEPRRVFTKGRAPARRLGIPLGRDGPGRSTPHASRLRAQARPGGVAALSSTAGGVGYRAARLVITPAHKARTQPGAARAATPRCRRSC